MALPPPPLPPPPRMGGFSGAPVAAMSNPANPFRASHGVMGANNNKNDRTVYIGNVQPHMNDAYLRKFFTEEIAKLTSTMGYPVVERVTVNHEKYFAFVDFGTNEAAELALGMDGVFIEGSEIRIRRPNQGSNAPSDGPNGEQITEGIYTENGLLSLGASSQSKLQDRFNRVSSRGGPAVPTEEVYDY